MLTLRRERAAVTHLRLWLVRVAVLPGYAGDGWDVLETLVGYTMTATEVGGGVA